MPRSPAGRGKAKRVRHSRPLLQVVPRDQPFVYHSPDYPMLQSPLPVQHPPALEQLLLQLLRGRKMLIRRCRAPRDPRPRTRSPAHRSHLRSDEGCRTLGETKSRSTVTVRGRLIFPPGGPMARGERGSETAFCLRAASTWPRPRPPRANRSSGALRLYKGTRRLYASFQRRRQVRSEGGLRSSAPRRGCWARPAHPPVLGGGRVCSPGPRNVRRQKERAPAPSASCLRCPRLPVRWFYPQAPGHWLRGARRRRVGFRRLLPGALTPSPLISGLRSRPRSLNCSVFSFTSGCKQ